MGIGVTAGLAIAAAGAGAGVSASAARRQNKAIAEAQEAQMRAARIRQNQLSARVGAEKAQRLSEAQRIRAQLRVAAGEAGTTTDGSFGALIRQADIDAGLNTQIIDFNFANQVQRVRSGFEANSNQLAAQTQNPLLQAFMGGLQGAGAGLSIGQGVTSLAELGGGIIDSTAAGTSGASVPTRGLREGLSPTSVPTN